MSDFNQRIFDGLSPTEQRLYLQYDCRLELGLVQLADLTGCKNSRTVSQLIYTKTFPIPTYKKGKSRLASIKHAAAYQEAMESGAIKVMKEDQCAVFGQARGKKIDEIYAGASQ